MNSHDTDTSQPVDPVDKGMAEAFGEVAAPPPQSVLRALESRTGTSLGVHLESNTPDDATVKVTEETRQLRDPSGRYQVLGEIGRGAVGVVYKGRDVDLGRDVAMKILREEYAERPDILARFVEEAQIGGQLQHPGIVPVYELGLQAGERPYFAMKLVKGETLAAQLARRSSPTEDRRRLLGFFEQVCQTVAYAHARRVVHRDLKPANVMIGAFGEVQVVDWGLAKVLPKGGFADEKESVARASQRSVIETVRSAPGSGTQSVAGSLFGTPAYMSPEQALGDIDRLDQRSDVFGLGAILCEILTGAPPYLQEDGDVVQQAARGDSAGAVARLAASGAHQALIALCKQCLSPAPQARPESAGQVAEAIAAYLSSVEERARQAEIHAAEARVRARSTVLLAAAAVLILALGGGAYLWVHSEAARRQADAEGLVTAALQEASARQGKARATGLEDLSLWEQALAAVTQAQQLAGSEYVGGALKERVRKFAAEVQQERQQAAALVAQRTKDQAMRDALLLARSPAESEVVDGDWELMDTSRVEQAYRRAFHTYLGQELEDLPLAQAASALGDSALAVELAAALDHWAMTRRGKAVTDERTRRLERLARLLDPEDTWRNDLRDLIPAAREKKAELLQLASTANVRRLPVLSLVLLGEALWMAGAKTEAVKVYRQGQLHNPEDFGLALRLVHLLRTVPAPNWQEVVDSARIAVALRPRLAGAWVELGLPLRKLRNQDEAIVCYRRALDLDPNYVWAHNNIGVALYTLGRLDEAIACYRKAIEIEPEYAPARSNLGVVLAGLGRLDEAIACYQRAIEIQPKDARARNNLGVALGSLGRFDEAIACLRKAIEIEPKDATAHTNLGGALANLGRYDEAITCYQKAIGINPKLAMAHFKLGNALAKLGRDDEAVTCYQKAIAIEPKIAMAHYNLGVALRNLGRLNESMACFQKAIAIEPKLAMAYNELGVALGNLGRFEKSIICFRKAIEIDPKYAHAHNNLGLTLAGLGRFDEAIACFQKTTAIEPRLAAAHRSLGHALGKLGRFDEAIASWRRAIEVDPQNPDALNNFGLALEHANRIQEADETYRRALEVDPQFAPAHVNLGRMLQRRGDFDGAMAEFKAAEALFAQQDSAFARQWQTFAQDRIEEIARRPALLEVIQRKREARDPLEWDRAVRLAYNSKQFSQIIALTEKTLAGHRELALDGEWGVYNSACAAALWSADDQLEASERTRIRGLALGWLSLEVGRWENWISENKRAEDARQRLEHALNDKDFASIRGEALEKLPEQERKAWQALWERVRKGAEK